MTPIEEIQTLIHQTRLQIGSQYTALSEEVNVIVRFRNSVRRQPWSWIGGALAMGVVASFFKKNHPAPILESAICKKENIEPQKKSSFLQHASTVSSLVLGETSLALGAGKVFRILMPLLTPIVTEYITQKLHSHQQEDGARDTRP